MIMQAAEPRLILASASPGRAALLRAAGLKIEVMPSPIDEAEIKRSATAEDYSDADTALLLAELKAQRVSNRIQDALVIGADQILVCEGLRYDKPIDLEEARKNLKRLNGKPHQLVTAVTCLRAGKLVWKHVATPELVMREMSDGWIDAYVAAEGTDLLGSVGAYRIEGRGLQCFKVISGEHAAIIGLPMLALLGFLRQHGVLAD